MVVITYHYHYYWQVIDEDTMAVTIVEVKASKASIQYGWMLRLQPRNPSLRDTNQEPTRLS